MMGGSVTVDSTPGEGTTIVVHLPSQVQTQQALDGSPVARYEEAG